MEEIWSTAFSPFPIMFSKNRFPQDCLNSLVKCQRPKSPGWLSFALRTLTKNCELLFVHAMTIKSQIFHLLFYVTIKSQIFSSIFYLYKEACLETAFKI